MSGGDETRSSAGLQWGPREMHFRPASPPRRHDYLTIGLLCSLTHACSMSQNTYSAAAGQDVSHFQHLAFLNGVSVLNHPTQWTVDLNEGERQRSSLTLHNPTRHRFAFKVKTTSPKSYVVKPSVGFVEPNSSFKIVIIKQRNPKPTVSDKFLIEAMPTTEKNAVAAESKLKSGNKDIRLIRVPVFLDAGSSTSENNGNGGDILSQAMATMQSEECFPPTPATDTVHTQSPSRSSIPVDAIHSTTEARDGLVCVNSDITFRYNGGTSVISSIRLYNPTDDRYAFKIRSTFPKGFKVKPSQGFIKPRTAVDVEVVLLNSRGVDFTFSKFLVQSFVVDFTDEVITDAMYHKAKLYKAVRETELDIKLVGFEDRGESEITSLTADQESAAAAYEIRYLRKQLFHMESELRTLKEQVTHQHSIRPNDREETSGSGDCVGCMHVSPLFRFRRNRRPESS